MSEKTITWIVGAITVCVGVLFAFAVITALIYFSYTMWNEILN